MGVMGWGRNRPLAQGVRWVHRAFVAASLSAAACVPPPAAPYAMDLREPKPSSTVTVPSVQHTSKCGDAVAIPGGRVKFTNPPERWDVEVAPFCIDRTEVTCAEFEVCISSGSCRRILIPRRTVPGSQADQMPDTPYCDRVCPGPGRAAHPMVCVDFLSAQAFCEFRGGRLPTVREWYLAADGAGGYDAASAVEPTIDVPRILWDSRVVGSFTADVSKFGVLDMIGNVHEWVAPDSPTMRLDESSSGTLLGVVLGWGDYPGPPPFYEIVREPRDRRERLTGFRCAYDNGFPVRILRKDPPNDDER